MSITYSLELPESEAAAGVISSDAVYANAREGAGLFLETTQNVLIGQANIGGTVFRCYQILARWDTSTIKAREILSAQIKLDFSQKNVASSDFVLEARSHSWGPSGTVDDFVIGSELADKTLLATLASTAVSDLGVYYTMTSLEVFKTVINQEGFTEIVFASDRQRTSNAPSVGNAETLWSRRFVPNSIILEVVYESFRNLGPFRQNFPLSGPIRRQIKRPIVNAIPKTPHSYGDKT